MPCAGVEVFTGAGRRRTWTAEQKARIVAESCESGETVSAVARRHGLTPQQLFGWRRQARQCAEREAGKSGPAFTPVVVESCRAQPGGSHMIEIVLGAATVRVPPGIDAVSLTTALRVVKAAT